MEHLCVGQDGTRGRSGGVFGERRQTDRKGLPEALARGFRLGHRVVDELLRLEIDREGAERGADGGDQRRLPRACRTAATSAFARLAADAGRKPSARAAR